MEAEVAGDSEQPALVHGRIGVLGPAETQDQRLLRQVLGGVRVANDPSTEVNDSSPYASDLRLGRVVSKRHLKLPQRHCVLPIGPPDSGSVPPTIFPRAHETSRSLFAECLDARVSHGGPGVL